jgi:NTP pyrophosphatase (non-canonical NTP hydrolase)
MPKLPDNGDVTERLALLAEEMGEAAQVIGKALRHGMRSRHPARPQGPTNAQMLEEELGHVKAAICLLIGAKDITIEGLRRSRDAKLDHVVQYLHQPRNKRLARLGGIPAGTDRRRVGPAAD